MTEQSTPWNEDEAVAGQVELLLQQWTLDQKIDLVSGKNYQLNTASNKYYFVINASESIVFFNQFWHCTLLPHFLRDSLRQFISN